VAGSEVRKAVAAKRLSFVDDFVKASKLSRANEWLTTGFQLYPDGSTEEKALVAKGVSLADDFVKAGMFDVANDWLERGYDAYMSGSEERKAVAAKQELVRRLRSSEQMGAAPKVNFTALHAAAKQELARLKAVGASITKPIRGKCLDIDRTS